MTLNQGKLPLILWGAVENLDLWTKENSVTVTTGQADPIGGTGAYLINDASGAAIRYIHTIVAPGVTDVAVYFFLKQGTATDNTIWWYDDNAGLTRREVRVAWAGGIPTLTNISGTTTLDVAISLGSSWWLIRLSVTGIVTANTNRLRLAPAATSQGDTASTGTVVAYRRSVMIFGRALDEAKAFSMAAPGSELVTGGGGSLDSWLERAGTFEYFLSGILKRIPADDTAATAGETVATGWNGKEPYVGVNCGVEKMLQSAWGGNSIVFCPDRAEAGSPRTSYLLRPKMDEPPEAEPWVTTTDGLIVRRDLPLLLRSTLDTAYPNY